MMKELVFYKSCLSVSALVIGGLVALQLNAQPNGAGVGADRSHTGICDMGARAQRQAPQLEALADNVVDGLVVHLHHSATNF